MSDTRRKRKFLRGARAHALPAGLLLFAACVATHPAAAQTNAASLAQTPAASSAAKAPHAPAEANAAEDFYIIISLNQAQNSLVLKLPTEVTTVMAVNNQTVYLDETGKRITFDDLHAGDTVYVTHRHAGGEDLAVRIRKGPMTLAELHRRYVRFQ
jgi:hypothetical protein